FSFRKGEADGAEAAERALGLDPNLAEAHAVRARHLINSRRYDEAAAELGTALRLDPESWEANKHAGLLSFRQRRLDDAVRYYRKTTDLSETDFSSPMMLVTCYSALGDNDSALRAARITHARAQLAVSQDHSNGSAMATGTLALAILGQAEQARDWAIEILEGFSEAADAFWLDHAKVHPELDQVRDDPRFAATRTAAETRLA